MAFHFFDFIRPKNGKPSYVNIPCKELMDAAKDFAIRNLCFNICVNMIANAMGRCEFRTFINGTEKNDGEYYLWNYEPNTNQNSTAFVHKLIAKLYADNEALIVSTRKRDGSDALVVADSWNMSGEYPSKQNEYKCVQVGDFEYSKTFKENDVIHLQLNNEDIKPVVDAMYNSYYKLANAAMKAYTWGKGQHWKVTVNQLAQGAENWAEDFQKMITEQVKPFLESDGAVLPVFDGYQYDSVGDNGSSDTRDIKELVEDIFDFTARGFLIPAVLVNGKVEATTDANSRFLTYVIDPLCDQLGEEITRKRYGFDEWKKGNFLRVDSSSIIHFDLFAQAANVEKLVGSGAFTINDVRRAANQASINEPWADEHYMTLNISTMNGQTNKLNTPDA